MPHGIDAERRGPVPIVSVRALDAYFGANRAVRDATLDFSTQGGSPHGVVVLTGPPACGKTRALEAILAAKEAIAPYGPMVPGAPWIAAGATTTKIKLAFRLDDEEQTFTSASSPVLEAEVNFLPQRARGTADEGLVALLARYAHGGRDGKVERAHRPPPASAATSSSRSRSRSAGLSRLRAWAAGSARTRSMEATPTCGTSGTH